MQKLGEQKNMDTYWTWLGKGLKNISPKRWKWSPLAGLIIAILLITVGVPLVFSYGVYWVLAIIIPVSFFLGSHSVWIMWKSEEGEE